MREGPQLIGRRVTVTEPHRHIWEGEAIAEKWSKVTGWWIEVRDADSMVWSVNLDYVAPQTDTLF